MRIYLMLVFTVVILRAMLAFGQAPYPLVVTVHPNLECARDEGFHVIAGYPPLTIALFEKSVRPVRCLCSGTRPHRSVRENPRFFSSLSPTRLTTTSQMTDSQSFSECQLCRS